MGLDEVFLQVKHVNRVSTSIGSSNKTKLIEF